MTTADHKPHPWGADSAPALPGTASSPPRRVAKAMQESTAAAHSRMLLDEHRSQNGRCVRCSVAPHPSAIWPPCACPRHREN